MGAGLLDKSSNLAIALIMDQIYNDQINDSGHSLLYCLSPA
jgi:hypothetical protein